MTIATHWSESEKCWVKFEKNSEGKICFFKSRVIDEGLKHTEWYEPKDFTGSVFVDCDEEGETPYTYVLSGNILYKRDDKFDNHSKYSEYWLNMGKKESFENKLSKENNTVTFKNRLVKSDTVISPAYKSPEQTKEALKKELEERENLKLQKESEELEKTKEFSEWGDQTLQTLLGKTFNALKNNYSGLLGEEGWGHLIDELETSCITVNFKLPAPKNNLTYYTSRGFATKEQIASQIKTLATKTQLHNFFSAQLNLSVDNKKDNLNITISAIVKACEDAFNERFNQKPQPAPLTIPNSKTEVNEPNLNIPEPIEPVEQQPALEEKQNNEEDREHSSSRSAAEQEEPVNDVLKDADTLQNAVKKAQENYNNWYTSHLTWWSIFSSPKDTPRGANGRFSYFRHGSKGQERASKWVGELNNMSDQKKIEAIKTLLSDSDTPFHRHSFASFLLDELRQNGPWKEIQMGSDALYDRDVVSKALNG